MNITRRKFVILAPLAAGVALTADSLTSGQTRMPKGDPSSPLVRNSYTAFNTYLGTDFTFAGTGKFDLPLTLTDVRDTKPAPDGMRSAVAECFEMTFTGPIAPQIKQGTYHVKHFALGEFDLFITEGAQTRQGKEYIAVVNHLA